MRELRTVAGLTASDGGVSPASDTHNNLPQSDGFNPRASRLHLRRLDISRRGSSGRSAHQPDEMPHTDSIDRKNCTAVCNAPPVTVHRP